MGQVRHGCATTTHAVRAAIQRSQASLAALSKELGINAKTVAKWRKRTFVEDVKTGPKEPRSTVLTEAEEAMIVAFRRHTLLPLDDCLYALQPSVPHLTRSALHRCLQRHGISRLPDVEGDKSKRQRFKRYPIGFFHIDIAEVQTAEGKLYLFVGIDRTSKFAVTQLVEKADRRTAWEFLQHMLEAVPYQVHTVLTDNGIQFAEQPRNRNTIYSRPMRFDIICEANGIEHRLTKPNHPWTNGQVERMNRTIKDATVKRFHYDSHDQLRTHLADFIAAYNFARRLKTLNGLTPYEYICKIWTSEPHQFILNPIHQMPGPNTSDSLQPSGQKGGHRRFIGRSKGGLNSKLHAVTDGKGRPIGMFLSAGQTSDYIGARALLSSLPTARTLLADRGYDAGWFRNALIEQGIQPCIPSRKCRKVAIPHDTGLYRERHRIENAFARLKDWRRIATRYDRCADLFLSACALAAVVMFWI